MRLTNVSANLHNLKAVDKEDSCIDVSISSINS